MTKQATIFVWFDTGSIKHTKTKPPTHNDTHTWNCIYTTYRVRESNQTTDSRPQFRSPMCWL